MTMLRDLLFNLFECPAGDVSPWGRGPYADADADTVQGMLNELQRFCRDKLAATWADGDRNPPVLHPNGDVTLPSSLKEAYAAYRDAGWLSLGVASELGGQEVPAQALWAASELIAAANPVALYYWVGLTWIDTLRAYGTAEQKARFLPGLVERHWGGAMVLTEADAGSDVGNLRTTARQFPGDEKGAWRLEGTKRFITNGENDAVENILYYVLARPQGAPKGTKSLGLFIVPRFHVNPDGGMDPTRRNGVRTTKLEHKLGIKASTTCEMNFGGDGEPCIGYLLGDVIDGIKQMFHIIRQARMAVGVKSCAQTGEGYRIAAEYARIRVQGPDLLNIADKQSPRVPILRHPDVRRMLLRQKAHAEGMRALYLFAAALLDDARLAEGADAKAQAAAAGELHDLLLPLVKGWNSERGFECLSLSLQCFGGAGYTQEVPAEQLLRDQRIDLIYEGTTHIQALDLFFRKIAKDGGGLLGTMLDRARGWLGTIDVPELATERAAALAALDDVAALAQILGGKAMESLYHVGWQGNRALFALGDALVGALLVRQAAVAWMAAQRKDADAGFYQGKIASARYFAREVLPEVAHARRMVESGQLWAMELPDDAW